MMQVLQEIEDLLRGETFGPAALAQARALCRRLGLPPAGSLEELFSRLDQAAETMQKFRLPEMVSTDRPPVKPGKAPEPEGIDLLRARAKALHKRQAFVHAHLKFIAGEPKTPERKKRLFEFAREIMEEITPELDHIYDQIRDYEQTGKLPNPGSYEEGQAAAKKIHSLRSSISRYRGLIKRTQDRKKRGEYLDRIDALEEQIRALL